MILQSRVTDDYGPGNDNWMIGVTSMFADALGLAPSKDVFWTTSHQPGNPYGLYLNTILGTLMSFSALVL